MGPKDVSFDGIQSHHLMLTYRFKCKYDLFIFKKKIILSIKIVGSLRWIPGDNQICLRISLRLPSFRILERLHRIHWNNFFLLWRCSFFLFLELRIYSAHIPWEGRIHCKSTTPRSQYFSFGEFQEHSDEVSFRLNYWTNITVSVFI